MGKFIFAKHQATKRGAFLPTSQMQPAKQTAFLPRQHFFDQHFCPSNQQEQIGFLPTTKQPVGNSDQFKTTKQPEGGIFAERRVEHTTNHLFSEKAKMGGVGLAGKGWNGAGGLGVRLQYDNQNEIVNLWAYLTMLI